MRFDDITLNAYLDGELSRSKEQAVETVLSESSEARTLLARQKAETTLINRAFEALGPPAGTTSPAPVALRHLRTQLGLTSRKVGINKKVSEEDSPLVWEAPSLFIDLKTLLTQFKYHWKRSVVFALLAITGLMVIVGLSVVWWPGLEAIRPEWPASVLSTEIPGQKTATLLPPAELEAGIVTLPATPRFNEAIELLGYKLSEEAVLPGDRLTVTLYWRSLRPVTKDYTVFIHMVADEFTILTQHDSQPADWQSPTSDWQPGQIVEDEHPLQIPANLEAGSYELVVGMYDGATDQRMNVVQDGTHLPEAAVPLPPVIVESTDPAIDYIVALQPIPQGTLITSDLIGRQAWTVNFPTPDRVVDEAEVIGKVARTDITKGQILERRMVADAPTTPPTPACPVTLPPAQPFIPPEPYSPEPPGPSFWYGDESLWTALPLNGSWSDLPDNPDGYTQKLFWWREGYSWTEEPEPALHVTGHRLDDPSVSLLALPATNAFAPDIQSAMLVGVDFPTPGCWQITGRYADAELSYIVQVDP